MESLEFKQLREKHLQNYPALGQEVEIFMADGLPCCRWSNGEWYHYNVKNQTWF